MSDARRNDRVKTPARASEPSMPEGDTVGDNGDGCKDENHQGDDAERHGEEATYIANAIVIDHLCNKM